MADKERETEAREERNLGREREKERASPLRRQQNRGERAASDDD